jgi:hypothetical protein
MLNELQPVLNELLDLACKIDNFNATLAAACVTAKQSSRNGAPNECERVEQRVFNCAASG